jgi:hypothetical protein
MSYVLHIWQQPAHLPLPGDPDGAAALVDALQEHAPDAPSRFAELAARLTRRYPCLCSPEAQHVPEHRQAWSEGPLDGVLDTAVYGIGLNARMVEEVRPFVVRTALALGLNVADDQEGRYHLRDRRVLSVRGVSQVVKLKHSAVLGGLTSALDAALREQGFRPEEGQSISFTEHEAARQYRHTFPGGSHTLRLTVEEHGDYLAWNVLVGSRFDRIGRAAAYFAYGAHPPGDAVEREVMVLFQRAWLQDTPQEVELDANRSYVVRTHEDIRHTSADMLVQMRRRLFSILAMFKSARGVNIVLNPQPLSDSFYFTAWHACTHHVLAAYYARDPRLGALCDELLERTRHLKCPDDDNARHLDKLRRCIAYVRANPLAD